MNDNLPVGDDQEFSEKERYYTLTAYSDDHEREAEITLEDGEATWHQHGLVHGTREWRMFMHAIDLVKRDAPGDQEAAIALFGELFGAKNVFLKKDEI